MESALETQIRRLGQPWRPTGAGKGVHKAADEFEQFMAALGSMNIEARHTELLAQLISSFVFQRWLSDNLDDSLADLEELIGLYAERFENGLR